MPSHNYNLNGGKTHFHQLNRIWHISFDFKIVCYKTLLDFINISPRFCKEVVAPNFTPIQENVNDKSFKEGFLFIPHHKVCRLTIVFKTKIRFSTFIVHFLDVVVPVKLVMDIKTKKFVGSHFLQDVIIIQKRSVSGLIIFYEHNLFCRY